ncbi:hypothetical protein PO878_03880 [Iamia majanohamensis]|uniref:Uncharacterized protein n=1 Tax=Iamia majanohamensis TaxID=467976 RepID=A0AAE9YG14_9ACTN|nr:hypothetical protein [Iamia majanohamensis]WCO67862.1 hypothetical protein PO878_03880 [Iamia majanohamensis]
MEALTRPNALTTNAPATATTLTAVLTPFLLALAGWGLSLVPDSVPEPVTVSGGALVVFLVGVIAWRIGRYAQRWTYPQVLDPELVDLGADPLPPIDGQTDKRQAQMVRPRTGDVPDFPEGA